MTKQTVKESRHSSVDAEMMKRRATFQRQVSVRIGENLCPVSVHSLFMRYFQLFDE